MFSDHPTAMPRKPRGTRRGTPGVSGLGAALLLLAVISLTACSDSVTGPGQGASEPAGGVLAATSLRGRAGRGFPCRLSRATGEGPSTYRYGTATLTFPHAALAPNGATIYYRVRYQAPGALPVATASCVIPNTALAIGIADNFFGAQHGVKVQVGKTASGEVTVMGCVGDGTCSLEAVNVVVPPKEVAPTEEDPCARGACWDRFGTDGGIGDYGDYSDAGTGTDPTWGDPPKPCDTPDAALNSAEIQAAMQQIWEQTNANASDQSQRTEHGGWIIETSNGFSYQAFGSTSTTSSCGIGINEPVPPGAVGFIHSHPWANGEPMEACGTNRLGQYATYRGNASRDDIRLARDAERVSPGSGRGYIIDKSGITGFSPYTRATDPYGGGRDERFGRCGY
jgi:hypothetical protein